MIIDVSPNTLVHRIGGAHIENLRLSELDLKASPPGISVLLFESAEDASERMKLAFKFSKKWKRTASRVSTAVAADIAAAGFQVIDCPTHALPNHGRIIHTEGISGFTDENLARLIAAFAPMEEYP